MDLDGLPGRDLVERGLADTLEGRSTPEALLVAIGRPRLEALGLKAIWPGAPLIDPEIALYVLLGKLGTPDPYARYNALLRELVSFVRALEHRVERERRNALAAPR